jgi:hypothetical protein
VAFCLSGERVDEGTSSVLLGGEESLMLLVVDPFSVRVPFGNRGGDFLHERRDARGEVVAKGRLVGHLRSGDVALKLGDVLSERHRVFPRRLLDHPLGG